MGLLALAAMALPGLAGTLSYAGREYERLSDWCKGNGLEVAWVKRDQALQVTGRGSRVSLAVDSREARVNGVQVWLVLPVLGRNGSAYVSRLDLRTTLHPILFPRSKAGAPIRSICLDPGHGGKDPGNRVGSYLEKKYALVLAQEVRDQLKRLGFKVTLTRSKDAFIDLPARPDLARRRGADLFISLHLNSTETSRGTVQGAEVYCLTPSGAASTNARGEGANGGASVGNRFDDQNMFLAYQMQRALTRTLGAEDRGVRRARFAVLRDAAMPAVLIEGGFMSHPQEGNRIFSAAYRKRMATAIADGLLAYKRVMAQ